MANYTVSKLKFANDSTNTYEMVDATAVHDNIIALTSSTISSIPVASGVVFTYTVAANDVLTFATAPADRATAFELWLTMPDPAVTFTFGSTIVWEGGSVPTFSAGTTTRLKFEYVENTWHGAVTPDMSEYLKKVATYQSGSGAITWTYINDAQQQKVLLSIANSGNFNVVSALDTCQVTLNPWTFNLNTGAGTVQFKGHNQNTPGGFLISNATTGNLPAPGGITVKGDIYSTLTAASGVITVPALTGEYYVCTVAQDDTITFASTTSGYVTKFSFDITVPETSEGSGTPVTFSFSDTITWEGGSMPTFGVGTHKLKFECVNGVWYGSYRPDMSEYVKFTDSPVIASTSGSTKAGVVKIDYGTPSGIFLSTAGASGPGCIRIKKAQYGTIRDRTPNNYFDLGISGGNHCYPIVPATLDYAVKVALSDCKLLGTGTYDTPWTDAEKASATDLLNAQTKFGNKLTALDSTSIATIPAVSGSTYTYTLTGDETITFGTPTAGYSPTFELWLTMPSTAVTFSFGTTILWADGNGRFSSYNPAPDFTEGGLVYRLVFQYDGFNWLGNLVSVKEVQ